MTETEKEAELKIPIITEDVKKNIVEGKSGSGGKMTDSGKPKLQHVVEPPSPIASLKKTMEDMWTIEKIGEMMDKKAQKQEPIDQVTTIVDAVNAVASLFSSTGDLDKKLSELRPEAFDKLMMLLSVISGNPQISSFISSMKQTSMNVKDVLDLILLIDRLKPQQQTQQPVITLEGIAQLINTTKNQQPQQPPLTAEGIAQLLVALKNVTTPSQPPVNPTEVFRQGMEMAKTIFEPLMKAQTEVLQQRINDLNTRLKETDPSTYFEKEMDRLQKFQTIVGGRTPEEMKLWFDFEKEKMKIQREELKEARDDKKAEKLMDTIKEGMGGFAEHIGKPVGDAIAQGLKERLAKIQEMKSKQEIDAKKQEVERYLKLQEGLAKQQEEFIKQQSTPQSEKKPTEPTQ